MRLSIQRLRWVLLAGALLLLGVLAVYIGYGRYRQLAIFKDLIKHSGAHITHDTNGFTYSQSVKGKTVFTLHAKRATQLADGKWALHDADMTLYGRIAGRPDHIYGNEVEYDEKEGIARAIGEVHMDLQAPQALTGGKPVTVAPTEAATAEQDDHVIHIKTSGLIYLHKLGVAATDKQVEFHYGAMECTAQGAEFNTGQNILRLLADVKMDGLTHDKPLHVTALSAEIDRTESHATLAHPIVRSEDRMGKADSAVLDFESDGSIQRVQGFGDVNLSEATRQITAARLDATLNDDMQLKAAHLAGGVGLVDVDATRPMQGSASKVDAAFDAKGNPTTVTATGGAHFASMNAAVDRRGNPHKLARSLEGATIVTSFAAALHQKGEKPRTELTAMHATGNARAAGESLAASPRNIAGNLALKADASAPPAIKNTQIAADDLQVSFRSSPDGKPQPQHLVGAGHTQLRQDAPLGEQQTTTGDALDIVFASAIQLAQRKEDALSVSSAVQTGNVTIHNQAAATAAGQPGAISAGTAHRAAYDGAAERLSLTGDVHWKSDSGQLIAPTVHVSQQTGDAEAEGGVQATLFSAPGTAASAQSSPDAPVTHILAATAQMHHSTQLSEFRDTDAHPARMWQGASQVEAATLLFDGAKHTFSARPATPGVPIHAIFTGSPATPKPGAPARAASVIRAASPKMDYNDLRREATFTGGVLLEGSMGQVHSQRAVVFLAPMDKSKPAVSTQPSTQPSTQTPSPFSGTLDRVIVSGDVQLDQPGRKASGDQLLYTSASGNYILTGTPAKPPIVVDAQQGSVTGATLLFGDAGSTIVVAGDPDKKTRVRTETEVRP